MFEREKAEEIASRVKGVLQIRNNIAMIPRRMARPDDEIEADIENQLRLSPFVDSETITVSVCAGIAILQGRIKDERAFRIAEQEARQCGAHLVINKLRIAPP
jgi:osmotically-inducible protein OsmY